MARQLNTSSAMKTDIENNGFRFSARDGVFFKPPRDAEKNEWADEWVWLCSPIRILAKGRDTNQSNWALQIEIRDPDNHEHFEKIPFEWLQGGLFNEAIKLISNRGGRLSTDKGARDKLLAYFNTFEPVKKTHCRYVDRIGWHDQQYVMPNSMLCADDSPVIYTGGHASAFSESGTLEEWRDTVSVSAMGNEKLMFAISVAFAGPLIHWCGNIDGGFNFVGQTSSGKSTLLEVAASVFGAPDKFIAKWRTTVNGLESLCCSRNDSLLILDEVGQADPRILGDAIYTIVNGQAKARMGRDGKNKPIESWRVMLLSAGEIDAIQHMAQAGVVAKGGQVIRLATISADAGNEMGVFSSLHGYDTPKEFAEHLQDAASKFHGTAGAAFVQQLSDQYEDAEAYVKEHYIAIMATFDIPENVASEVRRVASRFAIAGIAGEIATQLEITGWDDGMSSQAAASQFKNWLANYDGCVGGFDKNRLFQQVHHQVQQSLSSMLAVDASVSTGRGLKSVGYVHTYMGVERYYILPAFFEAELCKGFSVKAACHMLKESGLLLVGQDQRYTQKVRIKAMSTATQRVYVLSNKIFEIGEIND